MALLDKPRLRNALKKLRTVESRIAEDFDPVETGQEMLDLLAVMRGFKPIFLHGRGLADPAWMTGVIEVATASGLRVVQGPCWNPLPPGGDFPDWYVACVVEEFAPHRPFYIARAPAVLREAEAICAAGGRPTIEQEARLLGYPACCVAEHHSRVQTFHNLVISRIEALAGGDDARRRELYRGEVDLEPENPEEAALLDRIFDIVPCPFGGWNLCVACREDEDSPSFAVADAYEALAIEVDEALYDLLYPYDDEEGDGAEDER